MLIQKTMFYTLEWFIKKSVVSILKKCEKKIYSNRKHLLYFISSYITLVLAQEECYFFQVGSSLAYF